MLRALIYGLTILHLGPGFAFAVVAFGCDTLDPALGAICQQDTFALFIKLTLAAWTVMIAVLLLKKIITNYMNKK
jgi:threonine/homoserine/homoserine lactone efflux protein